MKVYIIPHKGKVFEETRMSYFLKAFGEEVKQMRIIPFGKCNYSCPYCKRKGNFKQCNIIQGSLEVEENEIFQAVYDAVMKKQIVRLSGGDPCMYPELSFDILRYVKKIGGIGSVAHNGSDPEFVKYLVDNKLVHSISVDLKAENADKLSKITGISEEKSFFMWERTIQTLRVLKDLEDIKVDIRTCVFNNTDLEELLNIGRIIQQNSNKNVFWTLRIYSIVDGFFKETKSTSNMKELAKNLSSKLPNLKIGIRVKWENGAFFYYLNGQEI